MKTFPLSSYPQITTSEGESETREIEALERADIYARRMVIAGPLRASGAALARFDDALQALAPWPKDMSDETGNVALSAAEWAYRLGLMTGLRLAQATGGAR